MLLAAIAIRQVAATGSAAGHGFGRMTTMRTWPRGQMSIWLRLVAPEPSRALPWRSASRLPDRVDLTGVAGHGPMRGAHCLTVSTRRPRSVGVGRQPRRDKKAHE